MIIWFTALIILDLISLTLVEVCLFFLDNNNIFKNDEILHMLTVCDFSDFSFV